jgi:multimeric flavodoxin WrbA
MVKIIGICGSPRVGATDYAVKEALKAAEQYPGVATEYWRVRGKKITYCTHCDLCVRKKQMCHIKDDLAELENLFLAADGIIIGSPVYDMNITAQLAACFNRLRPMYIVHPGKLKNKVGGALVTAGTRHGGQETTLSAILNFFLMHEFLVTGGAGGCYNGGTIWSKDNKAQGAIDDTVGMNTVLGVGRAVAEAAIVTKKGKEYWESLNFSLDNTAPIRDH